ncbi:DUF952 domain-containing protein [Candidatus Pelagibacter sp.]|nr:DUF952 domain-containing protein [Candidatus Pelagibacter sp.]MDB2545769.1 DUF952 domain-containing protein [Candidatus Pelagibacter bacterium]MDC1415878.1 DUF952 domain-containing protein [Pelagibacteraceae bacterium]MDA7587738.1 DUF952 domain-containing protein [Candidatus Pelagibacter sp.]MDA8984424.1 DUF952 domain-containing protein [Candidatus Pelagibacter sp.]
MNLKYIFKIIDVKEWQKVKQSETYLGSSKDIEDGYIHFSGEDQVKGTLEKYYSKQENLVLLKVETLKLDHLIWEQASDGNMFPHLYSSLDLSNIVDEFEINLSDKGIHELPDNFN